MSIAMTSNTLAEVHADIHDGLARAVHEKGPIGEAAKRAARLFTQHAEKEERLLLPLLGLLPQVAQGKIESEMAGALGDFQDLEIALPDLLAEHHMISAALETLVEAAKFGERPDFGGLVARILDHIKLEEAIVYPSAVVLGRYLGVRLGRG